MTNCFVVMGFGEKTDLASGRKLNLDMTYNNIIKPAVQAEGLVCERGDEIRHAGMIDIPMYDRLFRADLVIADLSTANLNAMFELGVRYALKPRTTLIIAEEQFNSPFDVNHIIIHKYKHFGPDIGYGEVIRMQKAIRELIQALKKTDLPDSPVYSLLRLSPPRELQAQQAAAAGQPPGPGGVVRAAVAAMPDSQAVVPPDESYATHFNDAVSLINDGKFDEARDKLQAIYEAQTKPTPEGHPRSARPRVVQKLALATYKAGDQALRRGADAAQVLGAYQRAIVLLELLDPQHTTDPETVGLWSAVHKRRFESGTQGTEQSLRDLDQAIYSSERGFLIQQDYYNGINLAYLLDLRAALSNGLDGLPDRVLADRVRQGVVAIAQERLKQVTGALTDQNADKQSALLEEAYWIRASLAEALLALGDPKGLDEWNQAKARAPYPWMRDSTVRQWQTLAKLRGFSFEP